MIKDMGSCFGIVFDTADIEAEKEAWNEEVHENAKDGMDYTKLANY